LNSTLLGVWRHDTLGCGHRLHLNNAGAALMPRPVVDAMTSHLALEQEIGGYEAADQAADRIAEVYRRVAALVGAQARNIALVQSATTAFTQAMAAFDFMHGASWSSTGTFEPVDSARRFEQWEQPSALVLGLGESRRTITTARMRSTGSCRRCTT